ncbi:hypothetical protein [Flaviaesturariibacter amylovorans]|uniref:SCP2 domain-containing protein n=1 Tax=Flaviaesturariibacter amylovorans TaxID=1084520 RepID=A0ABP8HLT6_9BACT
MEQPFSFFFEEKERRATVHISLQDDGCFIFTIVKDKEIVDRFGSDIDFEFDAGSEEIKAGRVADADLLNLKSAILGAVKVLPGFEQQKARLIVRAQV